MQILDDLFRRAHALRVEARPYLTPEVQAQIEAMLRPKDRNGDVTGGLYFEKWLLVATGRAADLLHQARDLYWKIVIQMDGYVRKQTSRHMRRLRYNEFDDLYQSARYGCWRAAIRFDLDRGYKFITFADDWIRSFCDKCRNKDQDISVNGTIAASGQYKSAHVLRLDAPVSALDGDALLIDSLEAEEVETPDTMALNRLRSVMDDIHLTKIERASLENIGDDGDSMAEIGQRFGKSREWIRQVRNKAFTKITSAMTQPAQNSKKENMGRLKWPLFRKKEFVPGVCIIEGCNNTKSITRGVCPTHHASLTRGNRLEEMALPVQKRKRIPKVQSKKVCTLARKEVITPGICIIEGCDCNKKIIRGVCSTHHTALTRAEKLEDIALPVQKPEPLEIDDRGEKICLIKGCDLSPHGRGFCRHHYNRMLEEGKLNLYGRPTQRPAILPATMVRRAISDASLCDIEGCEAAPTKRCLCRRHYDAMRRHKTFNSPLPPANELPSQMSPDPIPDTQTITPDSAHADEVQMTLPPIDAPPAISPNDAHLEAIDRALGLPHPATEAERLAAIGRLRTTKTNTTTTIRLTREDLKHRSACADRAEAIRNQIKGGNSTLRLGDIDIPVNGGIVTALLAHAEELDKAAFCVENTS